MLRVGRQCHPVPCPTKPWRSRIAVPDVPPAIPRGGHVPVGIVLGFDDRPICYVGVLVQRVGEKGPACGVVGGRQAVAYRIEGVAVCVRPHKRTDDFRPDVVTEVVGHGTIIHSLRASGKRIVDIVEADSLNFWFSVATGRTALTIEMAADCG